MADAQETLEKKVDRTLLSFHTLFMTVDGRRVAVRSMTKETELDLYHQVLCTMRAEIRTKTNVATTPADDAPDSVDYYTRLAEITEGNIQGVIETSIREICDQIDGFCDKSPEELLAQGRVKALLQHARQVYLNPLSTLMKTHLGDVDGMPSRMMWCESPVLNPGWEGAWDTVEFITGWRTGHTPRRHRMMRYTEGKLEPFESRGEIKPLAKFFGYGPIKKQLQDYFTRFMAGAIQRPIMMDGPPGIGKTEILLAYLQENGIDTVVAEPKLLQQLPAVLQVLKSHKSKVCLFFDDLDPTAVEWEPFRVCVAGTHAYPPNVGMVLITNYEFPQNVYSRGEYIQLPKFNAGLCRAIITDALLERKITPQRAAEWTNQIGAYYVEKYLAGGIVELSPRSLIAVIEKVMLDTAMKKQLCTETAYREFTDEDFEKAYRKK